MTRAREKLAEVLAEKLNGGMFSSPKFYNGTQREVRLERADTILATIPDWLPVKDLVWDDSYFDEYGGVTTIVASALSRGRYSLRSNSQNYRVYFNARRIGIVDSWREAKDLANAHNRAEVLKLVGENR